MSDRQPPCDIDLEAAAAGAPRRGPCPGDDRLLAFYQGELEAAGEEAMRDHLASCAGCVARARDARDFTAAVGETTTAAGMATGPVDMATKSAPAAGWRRRAWIGVAAAVAGLAMVGIWSVRRGAERAAGGPGATISWNDLAVTPAPYDPAVTPAGTGGDVVYRDGAAGDPFAAAMEHYRARDFAAAETTLESLVAAGSGGEQARFYLAVTRLINGRAEDARRELASLEQSGGGTNRAELGWYLALALLKTGRPAEARDRLESISTGGGAHAAEAGALLDRIRRGATR